MKNGDTIIFDSVSRLSRNVEEGFNLYEELLNKGIELVFLNGPYINTQVYKEKESNQIQLTGAEEVDVILEAVSKSLLIVAKKQIKIAFEQSEKEIIDLQQRTKEGIETGKT